MGPNCDTPWTLAREPEGPLADHLDAFALRLYEQGFKRRVIGVHVRTAATFSRWLHAEHVAAEHLTDEHARRFLEKHEYRERVRLGGAATLRRLMEVLRRLGVCGLPTTSSEPTPIERIVAAFANHLCKDQGLSTGTLVQYCSVAKSFLSERFGTGPVDLATLRGLDVINFVQRQAARVSPARAKAVTIALRSFLHYARYCGGTLVDLAGTVPTVANWSMTGIPRAIAPEHLRAVLASCRRDTPLGRRDYAILLLLARLGLRSSEIVSLSVRPRTC